MAAAPVLPASPAPIPESAPLSEGARLLDTFIAPSKTFTDLRRNASGWAWLAPFLLIAVVWVAFVYTVDQKIGFRKITEDQIQIIPKVADQFEKMPPETREQNLAARTKGARYFAYGKAVLRFAWFALIAGVASIVAAGLLANLALRPIEQIGTRLERLTAAPELGLGTGDPAQLTLEAGEGGSDAMVRVTKTIERLG